MWGGRASHVPDAPFAARRGRARGCVLGRDGRGDVSLAGSAKDLVKSPGHVPFESLLKQVELSSKLHEIKRVVLINHQNCGAYGPTLESGSPHEFETHSGDLRAARSLVQSRFPELKVALYFAKLDGTFVEVA